MTFKLPVQVTGWLGSILQDRIKGCDLGWAITSFVLDFIDGIVERKTHLEWG